MLTDRERCIMECMFSAWMDADLPLYGGHSYQDVIDMLKRFGMYGQAKEVETYLTRLEWRGQVK